MSELVATSDGVIALQNTGFIDQMEDVRARKSQSGILVRSDCCLLAGISRSYRVDCRLSSAAVDSSSAPRQAPAASFRLWSEGKRQRSYYCIYSTHIRVVCTVFSQQLHAEADVTPLRLFDRKLQSHLTRKKDQHLHAQKKAETEAGSFLLDSTNQAQANIKLSFDQKI